jgi:NAD(P)H-dependent FMN reductase
VITVGIIIGSARPGRVGGEVAGWVHAVAAAQGDDAEYELVDLRDAGLPHLDEPVPALVGGYTRPHTTRWAATISAYDAFVFVTPEYNRSMPGSLKTAIDFLYAEWLGKSAGFVSYGIEGGVRAIEHLRAVMTAIGIADARHQVALTLRDDFTAGAPRPRPHQEAALATMLEEVVASARTLRPSPRDETQTVAQDHS